MHILNIVKGMEALIKQAFLHVDVLGQHVHEGHYDIIGPDGEIILPQVYESMVKPDWTITMHMWPMPEPPPKRPKKPTPLTSFGKPPIGIPPSGTGSLGPPASILKRSSSNPSESYPDAISSTQEQVTEILSPPPLPPPPPASGAITTRDTGPPIPIQIRKKKRKSWFRIPKGLLSRSKSETSSIYSISSSVHSEVTIRI
jgi:hypothetical protein